MGGEDRQQQPLLAVEEACLEQVHLDEAADGMHQPLTEGTLLAASGALIGPGAGITGRFDQIVLQIPIGEVVQVAVEVDDLHVGAHLHLLVHQRLVVAGERLGIEAQHPIRIPAAVADKAAKDPGEARQRVDGVAGRIGHHVGDGGFQLGGEPLVGIQPQHPVGLHMGLGQSALFAKAGPLGVDEETGPKFGGDGRGLVLTA